MDVEISGGQVTATVNLPTGQTDSANSLPVVIANDQSAVPISSADLGLKADSAASTDTGTFSLIALIKRALQSLTTIGTNTTSIATAANQATALTDLGGVTETAPASDTASSGLNGRLQRIAQRLTSLIALLPASLGQKAMAASLPVVIASDQTSFPVTVAAGTAIIGKVGIDQTTPGTTNLVALAANQSVNAAQINGVAPLMGNGVTGTGSQRVTIASDNTAFAVNATLQTGSNVIGRLAGKSLANAPVRNDYTSTSVTTAAYTQLVASTTAACTEIEIFDSSGQTLALATGGAGSEVIQAYIFPGGNGRIPLAIAGSTRVAVKAISATASVGELDINFYA